MAIEKKKMEIIAVSVMGALLMVVLAWQLWPSGAPPGAKGKDGEKQESPGTYREQLLKAEMMVKNLVQQQTEFANIQDKLEATVKDIPLENDQTWLSRQINAISAEAGVGDVSQRFMPAAAGAVSFDEEFKAKYSEKTWEVRMQCNYHELGKFLAGLEGANKFLEVADISVEGNEPAGQKVVLLIRYLVRKNVEEKSVAAGAKK